MKKYLLTLGLAIALPLGAFAAADTPVADAAMNRDFTTMQALIAKHVDVKTPQADGSTALHWAAHWNNLDAFDALLKAGADPKASTRLGATPMYLAANVGNAAMLSRLLAAGVDPNAPFLANGETALMVAARSGSLDGVRVLLDAGAKIDAKDTYKETTALLWAAEQGHDQVVAYLLSRGADKTARSKVTINTGRGQFEMPESGKALPPNAAAKGGLTALMIATRVRSLDTMKALLDGGAPINQRSGDDSTALTVALQNGDAALAKFLIDRGADVNMANAKNWTPLFLAVKARTREDGTVPNPVINTAAMFDVIKLMLDKGADPNNRIQANSDAYGATTWLKEAGSTPFLRAAWCGDLAVMKLLLGYGADPFIPTYDGTNALMALSGVGYGDGFTYDFGPPEESLEAMKLLVDVLGIPVNDRNDENITALHATAHKNFVLGLQYLVDAGADMTVRSNRVSGFESLGSPGNTVVDWATGVQVNMQSASFKPEAYELVLKLLKEHNVTIEGLSRTKGGRGSANAAEDR